MNAVRQAIQNWLRGNDKAEKPKAEAKPSEKKPEPKAEAKKFVEIADLKPGDKVKFIPDDKEFADEIVGTVDEIINDNKGVHIFNPTEKDRYNITRIWGRNGKFELIEKFKKEEKPAEKKKDDSGSSKTKNRLEAKPSELAADYRSRGMDRQRAWSEFVKDKGLKPGIDAKEFYRIYDSASSKAFDKAEKSISGYVVNLTRLNELRKAL